MPAASSCDKSRRGKQNEATEADVYKKQRNSERNEQAEDGGQTTEDGWQRTKGGCLMLDLLNIVVSFGLG